MDRRMAGSLIGLITGGLLFAGVTAAIIFLFWRLLPEAYSPGVDYVYGELMFWTSPLYLAGLLLSVLMALVGWPVVGFWIGGRASSGQSRAEHRRYSLLLGGGLGLMLALVCNLSIYFPVRLVYPWPLLMLGLALLQLGAGLGAGYLLSRLLWRAPAPADGQPPTNPAGCLPLGGQLLFLLLLPLIVCAGGLWLATTTWGVGSGVIRMAQPTATPTPAPPLLSLGDLPVKSDGLAADDLLLLYTPDGPLALHPGQTAPQPWSTSPDELTAVLAVPHAQFGHRFYSADGRHADLSLLPHAPSGAALVSPNRRYLAYETAPRTPEEADLGPVFHLYDLHSGEDRFISRENALFAWSPDSRYLYTRFRDRVFRYEPEGAGDRVTPLPAVNPQGEGAPALLATAPDGLVWRVSSALYWRGDGEAGQTVRLGSTLIARPFALSPDSRGLAWIRVSAPQLMVQRELPQGETVQPLPARNQLYHLAWSPQGDRLAVWAETGCQPGMTILPNPEKCPGDLYLVDLALTGEAAVVRLTDSGIGFQQITGLHWLAR